MKDKQTKALKLALEALEAISGSADDPNNGWRGKGTDKLFACEYCQQVSEDCSKIPHLHKCPVPKAYPAITAIKERLAQPEQEPVAWLSKGGKGIWFHKPDDESLGAIPLYTAPSRCPNCDSLERQNAELDLRLAEQDQAPFGFLTNKRQRFNFEPNATGLSNMPMTIDWKIPLYGSPQPQRTWVGLTDEDLRELGFETRPRWWPTLEAKLKEKNT